MESIQDKYPIFEANQVLSNNHLNQIFDYLDEQERLTRANLIGIGIVCGLEIRSEVTATASTIYLSRGCGVTSQGYLIVEPDDVALLAYREYTLPNALEYPPFKENATQYPLWELFPAGEPDSEPLGVPPDFLNDKAVLLFLELKKEGLRNCSPNDCNDKGSAVTATLRRLLITLTDLKKIIARANAPATAVTFSDLESAVLARLNLPDLRLPRYAMADPGPAGSEEVLAAFHAVFHDGQLVAAMHKALSAAYQAFQPLLQEFYPADPFSGFATTFGFLDATPQTTAQVRFLQYYYDFFDDLLKAYDELRWQGAQLLCACCPPAGLFPRHLMLGVLEPAAVNNAGVYRQHFIASAAMHACAEHTQELKQLFRRLVEMITRFTDSPPLPQPASAAGTDGQIRITPDKLAAVPLSAKAIPYYYLQNGSPPLYQLWSAEKTRRHRAAQNLSYRADEYTPAPPAFVTDALRYDLEPYNFLRIEGHLGKDYRSVLNTLLTLKKRYRLPVEIIALRSGVFDENMAVDLRTEECRFQDLETLYDALREELFCMLCESVKYFYRAALANSELAGGTPQLPLLKKCAPDFRYAEATIGAWYEENLNIFQTIPYLDIDQNNIAIRERQIRSFIGFLRAQGLAENFAHALAIYYLSKLAEALPEALKALEVEDFTNKYRDLQELLRFFRNQLAGSFANELQPYIPQEDLIDHLDQLLFSCKLEPLGALHTEYVRRVRALKQKQFLSFFLQQHPGIQHKAGVPLGGTFIIVYHDKPAVLRADLDIDDIRVSLNPGAATFLRTSIDRTAVASAFSRISSSRQYIQDPDIRFLLGTFTGQVPDPGRVTVPGAAVAEIFEKSIGELAGGTVIADFFLPYLCCSDCAPIQYVLPPAPLGFTVELGCTNVDGSAEATVTPQGGLAPYSYQLDDQEFQTLTGKPLLTTGAHTLVLRDSAGAQSVAQSLMVPGPLTRGEEAYSDDAEAGTYQVSFTISGGIAPYSADSGTVTDNRYTSAPVASAETISITITDQAGCTVADDFTHTVQPSCDLPCDGQSRRCAYRLWVQPPLEENQYENYRREGAIRLRYNGGEIDLAGTEDLLKAEAEDLNRDFRGTMAVMIEKLNDVINSVLNDKFGRLSQPRLLITYEPRETDPFGMLRIEYFVCETFSIEFDFSFFMRTSGSDFIVRYSNEMDVSGALFDGVIFINRRLNNKETRVPAFDCSERNQCRGSAYQPLCEGPAPELQILTQPLSNGLLLTGIVNNMDVDEISAWIWDVSAGQSEEPFHQDNPLLLSPERLRGPVTLTAITRKGCFGIKQR